MRWIIAWLLALYVGAVFLYEKEGETRRETTRSSTSFASILYEQIIIHINALTINILKIWLKYYEFSSHKRFLYLFFQHLLTSEITTHLGSFCI